MSVTLPRAVDAARADLRSLALAALKHVGPMTADECAAAIGVSPFSMRPRFSELRRRGRIDATGIRRRNASGCWAHVWRLTCGVV